MTHSYIAERKRNLRALLRNDFVRAQDKVGSPGKKVPPVKHIIIQ